MIGSPDHRMAAMDDPFINKTGAIPHGVDQMARAQERQLPNHLDPIVAARDLHEKPLAVCSSRVSIAQRALACSSVRGGKTRVPQDDSQVYDQHDGFCKTQGNNCDIKVIPKKHENHNRYDGIEDRKN